MSAHGMIFFSWWLLVITTWVKARMITGFSEGVLSSLLNHQQTQILLVVVIILIWMDTQPWYFHFFQSKTFLETKWIWTSFLTVELCHMLSLLFIYVGGSCIFNSCTIHTDLFPTVTDLAQLVLRLMVPACLISNSGKLWGKGFDPEPLDMGEASTIRKHTTPWCKYHLHTMTVQ